MWDLSCKRVSNKIYIYTQGKDTNLAPTVLGLSECNSLESLVCIQLALIISIKIC